MSSWVPVVHQQSASNRLPTCSLTLSPSLKYTNNSMPPYKSLPYDVLYHISLESKDCRVDKDGPSALFNLSLLDHRTRDVTIPVLFRNISFQQRWLKTDEEYVNGLIYAIMQNSRILEAVRFDNALVNSHF